jgi:type II secretory pathway pseudopilin PulG
MTLVEVLVVVLVVMVLFVLLTPIGPSPKGKARRILCCQDLKEIGIATRLWATDHTNGFPLIAATNHGDTKESAAEIWRYFLAMSNELANPKVLLCPADSRKPAVSFASLRNENISYFLNLDANETNAEALLAGDRNLTTNGVAVQPGLLTITSNSVVGFTMEMHVGAGNLLLSDGSVQQVTPQQLQAQISSGGPLINRLVIP